MSVARVIRSVLAVAAIWFVGCSSTTIPARDFLLRGEQPDRGYGAYGYLLFTKRPLESPQLRYLTVCEIYTANLESVDSYGLERSRLMPTFWLLEERTDANPEPSIMR